MSNENELVVDVDICTKSGRFKKSSTIKYKDHGIISFPFKYEIKLFLFIDTHPDPCGVINDD